MKFHPFDDVAEVFDVTVRAVLPLGDGKEWVFMYKAAAVVKLCRLRNQMRRL